MYNPHTSTCTSRLLSTYISRKSNIATSVKPQLFYKICIRHMATLHMSTVALLHIGPCGHSSLQSAATVAILHFNRRSLWPFCKSVSAQHSVHAACLAQCLYTLLSSSNMTFCCNSAATVLCTLHVCCQKICLLQTIPALYAPSPSPTLAAAAAAERCIYVHTDIQVSTDRCNMRTCLPCRHALIFTYAYTASRLTLWTAFSHTSTWCSLGSVHSDAKLRELHTVHCNCTCLIIIIHSPLFPVLHLILLQYVSRWESMLVLKRWHYQQLLYRYVTRV